MKETDQYKVDWADMKHRATVPHPTALPPDKFKAFKDHFFRLVVEQVFEDMPQEIQDMVRPAPLDWKTAYVMAVYENYEVKPYMLLGVPITGCRIGEELAALHYEQQVLLEKEKEG